MRSCLAGIAVTAIAYFTPTTSFATFSNLIGDMQTACAEAQQLCKVQACRMNVDRLTPEFNTYMKQVGDLKSRLSSLFQEAEKALNGMTTKERKGDELVELKDKLKWVEMDLKSGSSREGAEAKAVLLDSIQRIENSLAKMPIYAQNEREFEAQLGPLYTKVSTHIKRVSAVINRVRATRFAVQVKAHENQPWKLTGEDFVDMAHFLLETDPSLQIRTSRAAIITDSGGQQHELKIFVGPNYEPTPDNPAGTMYSSGTPNQIFSERMYFINNSRIEIDFRNHTDKLAKFLEQSFKKIEAGDTSYSITMTSLTPATERGDLFGWNPEAFGSDYLWGRERTR